MENKEAASTQDVRENKKWMKNAASIANAKYTYIQILSKSEKRYQSKMKVFFHFKNVLEVGMLVLVSK